MAHGASSVQWSVGGMHACLSDASHTFTIVFHSNSCAHQSLCTTRWCPPPPPPQVGMYSGERPIGAANRKQTSTMALCQPPDPAAKKPSVFNRSLGCSGGPLHSRRWGVTGGGAGSGHASLPPTCNGGEGVHCCHLLVPAQPPLTPSMASKVADISCCRFDLSFDCRPKYVQNAHPPHPSQSPV